LVKRKSGGRCRDCQWGHHRKEGQRNKLLNAKHYYINRRIRTYWGEPKTKEIYTRARVIADLKETYPVTLNRGENRPHDRTKPMTDRNKDQMGE